MNGRPYIDTSPAAVAQRMDELEILMEQAMRRYEELGMKSAEAWAAEERKYGEAFLSAEGPIDIRKQIAILACIEERFNRRVADHLVTTQDKALRKLHANLDAARTRVANARKEIELGQTGVRP